MSGLTVLDCVQLRDTVLPARPRQRALGPITAPLRLRRSVAATRAAVEEQLSSAQLTKSNSEHT